MKKENPLTKQLYLDTIDYIREKHKHQTRAFTLTPYYIHPIRVASLLMKFKESHEIDNLVLAALLHDVVEDTGTPLQEIEQKYGKLVASLVSELTSDKEIQKRLGKTVYLKGKTLTMSSWGLVIKLCDRLDNVMDFVYSPQSFIQKYGTETLAITKNLSDNYKYLSDTHKKIIQMIEDQVLLYYDTSGEST